MRYTVRWFDALTVMQEMGARVSIEAPPGQVLTDITREHYPEIAALAASTLPFERLTATARRRLEAE
jgi:malonate decarboxylase epsilon subunit